MDLAFSAEEEVFRSDVRGFLDAYLDDDLRIGARLTSGVYAEPHVAERWQRLLNDRGWYAANSALYNEEIKPE